METRQVGRQHLDDSPSERAGGEPSKGPSPRGGWEELVGQPCLHVNWASGPKLECSRPQRIFTTVMLASPFSSRWPKHKEK